MASNILRDALKNDNSDVLQQLEPSKLDKLLSEESTSLVHEAAALNAVNCLEFLIKRKPDLVNQADGTEQRWTPLHHAADRGHLQATELLQRNGADLFAKSSTEDGEETPVHLAALKGHLAVVRFLVEKNRDLKITSNGEGDYPIHKAALGNQTEVIEYFITHGVQIDTPDEGEFKRNCLHKATRNGELDLVKWLISKGANFCAKSGYKDDQGLAVHIAASFGHMPILRFFIENYPELKTATDSLGIYPIHCGALGNQSKVIEYFLGLGVDVNMPTEGNWKRTCLHFAAQKGYIDLVKWLISKGANVFAKSSPSEEEVMAIHLAANFGFLPVVKFFIENYPELKTATNLEGDYPIHSAVLGNQTEVVEYFLEELGMDIDEPDEGRMKRTCLHKAAWLGDVDLVKWLISKGANVYAKSSLEDSEDLAIHVAVLFGHRRVVKFFIEKYPDMQIATNGDGYYPIHKAAFADHQSNSEIIRYLLKQEIVDVNFPSIKNRRTCLHIAAAKGNINIVKFLLDTGADVNVKADDTDDTPVHLAASAGRLDVVRFLVEEVPDVLNEKNKLGATPLAKAQSSSDPSAQEVVEWLLSAQIERSSVSDNAN